jgi:hypothetical protein
MMVGASGRDIQEGFFSRAHLKVIDTKTAMKFGFGGSCPGGKRETTPLPSLTSSYGQSPGLFFLFPLLFVSCCGFRHLTVPNSRSVPEKGIV